MSRDPLLSLLRVRLAAVDEAQKAIAEAYRDERTATEAVRLATEALDLEMKAASSLSAGDEAVESFARWLPVGRKAIADTHARQREASAVLDQVRTVLLLARTSVRSVEILVEQQKAAKATVARRREQAELDEFATRPG